MDLVTRPGSQVEALYLDAVLKRGSIVLDISNSRVTATNNGDPPAEASNQPTLVPRPLWRCLPCQPDGLGSP